MPPLLRPLTRTFPLAPLPASATRALCSVTASPLAATSTSTTAPAPGYRTLSTTTARGSDDSHGSHYDPPSGWLFGVPPGEKYKKEGWEGVWVWGFWGSLGLGVVAWAYKPDSSIQTWALEEARRRLEAEGILPDPSPTGVASALSNIVPSSKEEK